MKPSRWIILLLVLALAGAGVWLARQSRRHTEQAARIGQLTRENAELRARAQAPSSREAPCPPPEPAAPSPGRPQGPAPAAGGDAAALERFRETLAESNANATRLQGRVLELEGQIDKLAVDNKRLSASEADLMESLSSANRLIEALQREVQGKDERIVQLNVTARKLREQNTADAQKLSDLARLSVELQELNRRRETYLASLLRRYKEVSDHYRLASGSVERSREVASPPAAGVDLARIENMIAMAEEDLRQLNALNAQALRLQKKLAER